MDEGRDVRDRDVQSSDADPDNGDATEDLMLVDGLGSPAPGDA
jgi:hypothetical protein